MDLCITTDNKIFIHHYLLEKCIVYFKKLENKIFKNSGCTVGQRLPDRESSFTNVSFTDDVKKAILFAREHDIRPTVVSSGHDYIGTFIVENINKILFHICSSKELRKDQFNCLFQAVLLVVTHFPSI